MYLRKKKEDSFRLGLNSVNWSGLISQNSESFCILKGGFLSDVWLLFSIYLIISCKMPSLASWTTTVCLGLLGFPSQMLVLMFLWRKNINIKTIKISMKWTIHSGFYTWKKSHILREREKNLRVKVFAIFMFLLFNIENISMFLFTLPLPDSVIVALILEGTGCCGFQSFLLLHPLK